MAEPQPNPKIPLTTPIRLISTDGESKVPFEIAYGALLQSVTIDNLLADLDPSTLEPGWMLEITEVKTAPLHRVLIYLQDYMEKGKVNAEGEPDDWEKQYIEVNVDDPASMEQLFDLVLAANYLDIKPLLALTTKKVADIVEANDVPRIREIFGLKEEESKEKTATKSPSRIRVSPKKTGK